MKSIKKRDFIPKVAIKYQPTKLKKKPLAGVKKMVKFLRKIYDKNTFELREEAIVILMGADLIPIGYFSMSKGDKDMVRTDFHYLFQMLFLSGAYGFIFSHNHPLAEHKPSDADFDFTTTLKKLADYFEFNFIDHIILTGKKHYSFQEQGLIW